MCLLTPGIAFLTVLATARSRVIFLEEFFLARYSKHHSNVFPKNLDVANIRIIPILSANVQEMKESIILVVRVTVTNINVDLIFPSNRLLSVESA